MGWDNHKGNETHEHSYELACRVTSGIEQSNHRLYVQGDKILLKDQDGEEKDAAEEILAALKIYVDKQIQQRVRQHVTNLFLELVGDLSEELGRVLAKGIKP